MGFDASRGERVLTIRYLVSRFIKKSRGSAIAESTIHPTSKIESGSTILRTTFGRHSFCGYDCTFIDCTVGAFCSISSKVSAGGSRHPMEYVSTSPVFLHHRDSVKTKFARHRYEWHPKTTIGNDVWVGEGVLIKGGVHIGDGAVVGMGSVVTKDVPSYAIVAGSPARLIRMRFAPNLVEALLKMQWWNYPDEELRRLGPIFTDPERMLKQEGFL